MSDAAEGPADRLRSALGMHAFGVAMYRQRVLREHPDWAGDEVETEVSRWLGATPTHPGRPASAQRIARIRGLAGLD